MSRSPRAYRPRRIDPHVVRSGFRRGKTKPKGVVWFGVSSFWGHLRHFLASAIATEDVDSRDWMTPDDPRELVERIASRLGGAGRGATLSERLGRDLWIDFVADTGDDVEVSERVAELFAAEYELPDPDREGATLLAPRGELLLFGGDTAYPVATGEEINNRVMVPFNRVLSRSDDEKPRALLGIPGNHDWYDGLDGFARMFRLRPEDDEEARPSVVNIEQHAIERYADWAREFMKGGHIEKPKTLNLLGYQPMQNASYFILPLTPRLHLFAVDRQLKRLDFRQRRFFADWRLQHPEMAPWVLLPDPPFKFGAPAKNGMMMLRAVDVRPGDDRALVMSGDIHHYERWRDGPTDLVIAGGGGAFLHPARIFRPEIAPRIQEWPGKAQSARLLLGVPWKVARGRSGFIPHIVYALLFAPQMWLGLQDGLWSREVLGPALGVLVIASVVYALIGGVRRGRRPLVSCLAISAAALTAALPSASLALLELLATSFNVLVSPTVFMLVSLLVSCWLSAFVFGLYLALLTRVGLEHTQAFTALDHPGFKHFLRLRIRADGDRVDGWCIGLADPLAKGAKPELVDQFTFRADQRASAEARE